MRGEEPESPLGSAVLKINAYLKSHLPYRAVDADGVEQTVVLSGFVICREHARHATKFARAAWKPVLDNIHVSTALRIACHLVTDVALVVVIMLAFWATHGADPVVLWIKRSGAYAGLGFLLLHSFLEELRNLRH